jgi:hypothetical protein
MIFYKLVKMWEVPKNGKVVTEYSCDCFLSKKKAFDRYDDEIWGMTRGSTNEEELVDLEDFYKIDGNAIMLKGAYDLNSREGVMLLLIEDHNQFAGWEHKNIILRLLDWKKGGAISREDLILLIQKLLELDFTQDELLSLGFKQESIDEAWGKLGGSLF